MARRKYNGLQAKLGADLTNSATSITFAAALTHSGGTNVPTLAGSDYIPLAIIDPVTGRLSEVVWLTAYTSGATTGTIARGKEGTSGVAHSNGDQVVHGAGVYDIVQRRPDDASDTLWGAPLSYDLEYEDDDTSGTLPSGWSWVNQGTSTYKQQWGAAVIGPQTSGGSDNNRLLVRSLPTESTWEATAKMLFVPYNANWNRFGLVLRDSTTGKFTFFGRAGGGGWLGDIFINDWNSATSFSGGESHAFGGEVVYFKIKKNASNWDFLTSVDGIGWFPFVTGKTAFSTYDQIGFGAHTERASVTMAVHWFRVR